MILKSTLFQIALRGHEGNNINNCKIKINLCKKAVNSKALVGNNACIRLLLKMIKTLRN
jgi:hypothetical protein